MKIIIIFQVFLVNQKTTNYEYVSLNNHQVEKPITKNTNSYT